MISAISQGQTEKVSNKNSVMESVEEAKSDDEEEKYDGDRARINQSP